MRRYAIHLWHAALHGAANVRDAVLAHPRTSGGVAGGVALAATGTYLVLRMRRPSAEEVERRRRLRLTAMGRLTDGTIVDALTPDGEPAPLEAPAVLLYRYRIGGVTYDCGQDVSLLAERAAGFRIDQPVQVRYDPRAPGNSILLSEDWSGLRMHNAVRVQPDTGERASF